MAIDWGEVIVGSVGQIAEGYFGGQNIVQQPLQYPRAPVGTYPSGGTTQKVTVDTVTGKITPCRRRRRRRLLTSSDLADLASLKAIVGGGAAMNAAVVKAVRR